jgi:hypothetical protein
MDRTAIGTTNDGTDFMSGDIAEAAMWDVALGDDEVLMLGVGFSPLCIRPQSLVAYWPLVGRHSPEIDMIGKFDMTVTGAAAANHPRIFLGHKRVA